MQTESHVVLRPFMVEELGLKGSELVAYALIHGFPQDGESRFTGSAQYVADSITRGELDAIGAKGRGGICGGVPQGGSQAGEGETG